MIPHLAYREATTSRVVRASKRRFVERREGESYGRHAPARVSTRQTLRAMVARSDLATTYAALFPDNWMSEGGAATIARGGAPVAGLATRLVRRLTAEDRLPLQDAGWVPYDGRASPVSWLPWCAFAIPIDPNQTYWDFFESEGPSGQTAGLILFEWVATGCIELDRETAPFLRNHAATAGDGMVDLLDAVMEEATTRLDDPYTRLHTLTDILRADPDNLLRSRTDALRRAPLVATYAANEHDNAFLSLGRDWWDEQAITGELRWSPEMVAGLEAEWAEAAHIQGATRALWDVLCEPASFAALLRSLATMLGVGAS